MDFDKFVNQICEDMKEARPELDFSVREVSKLQGESYTGISVGPAGSNINATIHMDQMFEAMESGRSYDSILAEMTEVTDRAIAQMPAVSVNELMDYSAMKDNLIMQLIPTKGNEEMLAGIPHKELDDLSVVYRFQLENGDQGKATVLINNNMLQSFGITADQLMKDAEISAPLKDPADVRNMSEVMAEMSGGLLDMPPSPMWVATVESRVNGAGVLGYPGFLDQAAAQLGGDFYVLPSSVHEVLLIQDDGTMNARELSNMVSSVNEAEVRPAEQLSDVAYHYDAEAHIFEKAQAYEDRMAAKEEMQAEYPEQITVLLVEPGERPREITVGTGLEDLQAAVGGDIEVIYPYDDPVGLIMNEEGKIDGLPLNRALRDEEGKVYDIVAGPFMVVGLKEDSFASLTQDQMKQFSDKFRQPETFVKMGMSVMPIPIPDDAISKVPRDPAKAAEKAAAAKPKKKTEPEH